MQVPQTDKPKILGPKPTIASKPKHLPPVRRISRDETPKIPPLPKQKELHNETKPKPQMERKTEKFSSYTENETFQSYILPSMSSNSQEQQTKTVDVYCHNEKCDKFRVYDSQAMVQHKTPTSPSTVCCSILSSATTDCCGIIPTYKKELNGKTMSKMESVDSNSSDSGGFKDFVQLDLTKENNHRESFKMHQRNISHPEFQDQQKTHQRYGSQPDYKSPEVRQSYNQNKQHFVANAQALAQYLPLTEQKMYQSKPNISLDRTDDTANIRQHITKFNVAQTEKTENKMKPRPNLLCHGQFQQSTKKLEELLSQRLEREKVGWKGQNCLHDGESSQDVEQKMLVQKQIQQKLQADLQQTVKQIQEIQSIELRLPQNRKWNEVSSNCAYFFL